jgi:glycosyltransferase involved in cell wall biosynthesis
MRILYLTQYFPPEIGAPQVRIPELMRHMVRLGHQVTILTAMPNYPKGRVFPGYRGRAFMSEPFEDMRVVRTFMYPTLSVGFIRRTTSQISFAASSALLGLWKVGRQDVILAGSPPLFIAPCALVLSRELGCPYIAVVADLWPEIAIETGILKSRPGIRMAQGLERMLYRYAVAVLTQTPGQALNIRERFPATRVDVLSGGVNTSLYAPSLRSDAIRAEFGVSSRVAVAFGPLEHQARVHTMKHERKMIDRGHDHRIFQRGGNRGPFAGGPGACLSGDDLLAMRGRVGEHVLQA